MDFKLYPPSLDEYKLKMRVLDLTALVSKIQETRMKKQGSADLENLIDGQHKLHSVCRWLVNARLEPIGRQYAVAGIVYHADFEFDPFTIFKLPGDSIWTRLKKSMPREHHPQVDKVYELLKAYVAPVASEFQ